MAGGPPNDACSDATIISSSTVSYNPAPYSITGAGIDSCENHESCSSGGSSNSVWYRYTATMEGTIYMDTFGSDYDTVLSVWAGCSGGVVFCIQGPEWACNNDYFFGSQSQIVMPVEVGATYLIKVAADGIFASSGVLDFNFRFVPENDSCETPTVITGVAYSDSPIMATATGDLCDAGATCLAPFATEKSVWYEYTPACDGVMDAHLNGFNPFATMSLAVVDACGEFIDPDVSCVLPTEFDCDGGLGSASITGLELVGGERYLIRLGTSSSSVSPEFTFVFTEDDQPVAEITTPPTNDCVCGLVSIGGTASASSEYTGWTLDFRPLYGGTWQEIASGQDEQLGTLGIWNTTILPEGHYLLRLTVRNSCGASETAINLLYVDTAFNSFDWSGPQEDQVVGGTVCLSGTIADTPCFDNYIAEYAPSGSPSFMPVDPANPVYTSIAINQTFASWDTIGLGITDGEYDLSVLATTVCDNQAGDDRSVIVDNTKPTVEITSPESCDSVEGIVTIMGTVNDANLESWALQYAPDENGNWVTIASGTQAVINDVLAEWDTSELPACAYAVRLVATDKSILNCNPVLRNRSEIVVGVTVGECSIFDSDCDGDVDLLDFGAFQLAFTG
jgi:hypothetical protein